MATTSLPTEVEKHSQGSDLPTSHDLCELPHVFQPELRGDAGGVEISGQPIYELDRPFYESGVPPTRFERELPNSSQSQYM